ncbi:hypothetical protein GE300_03220 [Rhodobacteraceae bacterium 2CG4]|uniref:DUF3592 domain-containing protein n=1 Tax=Halovulum marinum TaxID=2662447 RepID=A0A6L5YXF2_9RHOB|nr:DUF3592 domain-containing protein [Halovulum marinum]MSU88630.1 hypothetical protein [Halovulum marinum]
MDRAPTPKSTLRLFLKLAGWIALIPLLIAAVTGGIAMSEGRKAARLAGDGAVAVATITDKRITVTTDSDGDETTRYHLDFAFAAERRDFRMSTTVGRGFYNRLQVGETTALRYWRPDPAVNEIEPGATTRTVWVTKIASALALAAGLFWIQRCWRRARRALRVRDRGVRRRATVIGHLDTGVSVNKVRQYRLLWRDETGAQGRSWHLPRKRLHDWPEGAELTVYADPAGRLPAVWDRDVGAARAAAAHGAVRRG